MAMVAPASMDVSASTVDGAGIKHRGQYHENVLVPPPWPHPPLNQVSMALFSLPRLLPLLGIGIVGGVLSGAFGVGGGVIMVPLLILLLNMDQRRATALSLLAIVPTAVAGAAGYWATSGVSLLAAALLAVGGVVGSAVGSKLLVRLPLVWLRWLFIGFLLIVAVYTLLEIPDRDAGLEITVVDAVLLVVTGVVMGLLAGLFGIGGGMIAVPALILVFGASDVLAKGTSLAAMVPTAISGSIGNLKRGLATVREGAVLGLAATASSYLGVLLAHRMDPRTAAYAFAALLAFNAGQLTVRAIRKRREER